jgi:uncharacterized protein (TIGR03066 family)
MKHVLFFAAFVLVGLISSCSKDPEATPQELLIGKWQATKALLGATNALPVSAAAKTDLQVEFTSDGKVVFTWQNYNLTNNPPTLIESDLNGVYSRNGDQITITATAGAYSKTIVGSMVVTATTMVFTGTSGDIATFFSLIEADKI